MYELLNKLAVKLSSLEDIDGEVSLKNDEFEIDEKIFVVSGTIYYAFSFSPSDNFTPGSVDREYVNAELEVYFYDETEDMDIYLNEEELKHLSNNI